LIIVLGVLGCLGVGQPDPFLFAVLLGSLLILPAVAIGGLIGGTLSVLDELEVVRSELRGLRWQCEHEHKNLIAELRATIVEIRSLRWPDGELAEPVDGRAPTAIKEL